MNRLTQFAWSLLRALALIGGLLLATLIVVTVAHFTLGTPTPIELIQTAWGIIRQAAPQVVTIALAGTLLIAIIDQFVAGDTYRQNNPWYRPNDPDAKALW